MQTFHYSKYVIVKVFSIYYQNRLSGIVGVDVHVFVLTCICMFYLIPLGMQIQLTPTTLSKYAQEGSRERAAFIMIKISTNNPNWKSLVLESSATIRTCT